MALAALLCAVAPAASAQTLLYPNGQALPGESGALMAGAQAASIGGPDAAWGNPAGLAKERGLSVTLAGSALRGTRLTGMAEEAVTADAALHSVAIAGNLRPSADAARLVWSAYVAQVADQELHTRFVDSATIGGAELPPALATSGIDAQFPAGFRRERAAAGAGRYRVLASGLGLGYGWAPGFRVGFGAAIERVTYEERSTTLSLYADDGAASGGGARLSGFWDATSVLQGELQRLVYAAGAQADFGASVTVGLMARLPSRTLAGSGSIHVLNTGRLTATQGGVSTPDPVETLVIRGERLPFELRTPLEWRLGVALLGPGFLMEFDFARAEALGSYDVLPASASVPPSSVAAQAGPFRTSLRGRDRFAMGLAFARSSTESLLFGVATDESAVRTDDAVFRRVDIGTLGLGYSRSLGRASFTWGLVYQFTLGRPVQLPMRNDEGSREERLSLESLQLRLGASVFL